jgi:universal stress protein A
MKKMKKKHILCPVNFSKGTDTAVNYAATLAEFFKAKVTLLFVVEPLPMLDTVYPEVAQIQHALETEALNKLRDLAKKYKIDDKHLRIVSGAAKVEIIHIIDELGIDLVVMNDPGHFGLRHQFLGSTTRVIANSANCDVYIVRD